MPIMLTLSEERISTSFLLREAKVPGNESSWKLKFQGTKVPESKSSMYGTFRTFALGKVSVTIRLQTAYMRRLEVQFLLLVARNYFTISIMTKISYDPQ